MNGTFNGTQSTWTRDHAREEFYRQQDEQRRITERAVRAEMWLLPRLEGQQFPTVDAMRSTVTEMATMLYTQLDDELATVIQMACASLWKTGRYTALAQVA
jgi:hypothetical protein